MATTYSGDLVVTAWDGSVLDLAPRNLSRTITAPVAGDQFDLSFRDPSGLFPEASTGVMVRVLFPGYTSLAPLTWSGQGSSALVKPEQIDEQATYRIVVSSVPSGSPGSSWYAGSVTLMQIPGTGDGVHAQPAASGASGSLAHIGAVDPTQFFAGLAEITELYAGANRIWAKAAPAAPASDVRSATWDPSNSKLVISGSQWTTGTYEIDIPLWDNPATSTPGLAAARVGWGVAAPSSITKMTRIDGTEQVNPTFADLVRGIQGGHVQIVVDNSLRVQITVTGLNPSIPAWKAATLLRNPDAWIPMDTSSSLVDMSSHRHPMLSRSVAYTTTGPAFPYGPKGHYVGGGNWLKLEVPSDLTDFTISTWFIPTAVTHVDSTCVVFGSMPYAGVPEGAFYFGEVDLGTATAPVTPGFQLHYPNGDYGLHPGTDATHINRWPQFVAGTAYHIVFRSDKNVWINGEKRLHNQGGPTGFTTISPKIHAAVGLAIGAAKEYQGTMYVSANGHMGNFAYWRRSLSDADITAIYEAGRAA